MLNIPGIQRAYWSQGTGLAAPFPDDDGTPKWIYSYDPAVIWDPWMSNE